MNFIIFVCVSLKLFSLSFVLLLAPNPGDASGSQFEKNVLFVLIKQKNGIHSVHRYEVAEFLDFYQKLLGGVSRAKQFCIFVPHVQNELYFQQKVRALWHFIM